MKLDQKIIAYIQSEASVYAVPDGYPALSEMRSIFGDHTYFVGTDGLMIWEKLDIDGVPNMAVVAIILANWEDEKKTDLSICEPRVTHSVVVIPGGMA